METHRRSLAKSLSWRIVAAFATVAIGFAVTQSLSFALTIGVIEALGKFFLFYFHERMWVLIPYGLAAAGPVEPLPMARPGNHGYDSSGG